MAEPKYEVVETMHNTWSVWKRGEFHQPVAEYTEDIDARMVADVLNEHAAFERTS